jgi:cyclophilin family peptidyl-prolyl cis-trans isomerase
MKQTRFSFFAGLFIAVLCLASCRSQQTVTREQAMQLRGNDQLVTISTNLGEIHLVLFDETPAHKNNFLKLAREGFYNNTTFHRVIKDFMIQGGDPLSKDENPENDGSGGPGYTVPAELNPLLKHRHGAVAAARQGDNVNPDRASSGSQFYIVDNEKGTPFLDGKYTVFGQVVKGLDVVRKIAEQPKTRADRPVDDVKMKVTVHKISRKNVAKRYGYNYQL